MFDVIQNNESFSAKVDRINVEASPQRKVKISVVGQSNMSEYQGSDFNIIERLEYVY